MIFEAKCFKRFVDLLDCLDKQHFLSNNCCGFFWKNTLLFDPSSGHTDFESRYLKLCQRDPCYDSVAASGEGNGESQLPPSFAASPCHLLCLKTR